MKVWDTLYKTKGKVYLKPQEDMKKIIATLKKNRVKRVLDLGCGSGRHTIPLAKAGFQVYGMDSSKEGLKITRKILKQNGLKAKLKTASCYKKLPYKNGFFDAIISIQVIHHNYIEKIHYCIAEIERVLKPRGLVFVTVTANSYKRFATQFRKPRPRTRVAIDGREKGVPHYIYTKKLLRKDFKRFEILDIHKDSRGHYCLLGKLKE
jgi:2-polyprenyl-3-methyl-5-hydroxy-6-metoxy-1,4-benzoquinol methylase